MSDADHAAALEPSFEKLHGENQTTVAGESASAAKPKRIMSTIEFPYNALESCVEVAQKIHDHVGRSAAAPDAVAAWLESTVTSGTYKLRMSATRMFGLIGGERGAIRLTELGARAVEPATAAQAKAEAFLKVELYKKVFDDNRGRMLSKPAGLEAEMVALGVSPNQKVKARQIFEKSAREAGFFASGAGRLVEPTFNGAPASAMILEVPEPDPKPPRHQVGLGKSEVHAVAEDPLVQGLLSRMPAPDKGWPAADRARWLQTFAMNLELIYGAAEGAASVVTAKLDPEARDLIG